MCLKHNKILECNWILFLMCDLIHIYQSEYEFVCIRIKMWVRVFKSCSKWLPRELMIDHEQRIGDFNQCLERWMKNDSIKSHRSSIDRQQSELHVFNWLQSVQDEKWSGISIVEHSLYIIQKLIIYSDYYYIALLKHLKHEIAKRFGSQQPLFVVRP